MYFLVCGWIRYGKGGVTMKIYAIKEKDDVLGWLLYSEEAKKFYVELPDNADWIKTPMILDSFVKRGLHTVNSRFSLLWVQQRIIPSNRQNIRQILRDLGLQEYDEYELLIAGHGRCAQDDCYIEETESPKELEERFSHKVSGVSVHSYLSVFRYCTHTSRWVWSWLGKQA